MLTKTLKPYEFLARWTEGVLAGAHVGFVTVIEEDGVVISKTVGNVMPVNIGGGQGFPLADILGILQTDAITEMDAARTAETQAKAEKDTAVTQLAAKTKERDEALALVTAKDADIARLTQEKADLIGEIA